MKFSTKKLAFVVACAFLGTTTAFAQIKFEEGNWAEVQAKAKKENKHIFVDAYAEWCGPCKAMAKNVFTTKEVGDFYNKNFVSYKFDMEKGEGPTFAQTHQVRAYPTLMYFSPAGELVHKGLGGRDGSGFIALGETSLKPETQYYTLKKQLEKGTPTRETLEKFIKSAQEAGDEEGVQTLAPKFVKTIPEIDWAKTENASIVLQALSDNEILQKVLKMRPEFEKNVGKPVFNNAILSTFNEPFGKIVTAKNEAGLKELHKKLDIYFDKSDAEEIHLRLDYVYYAQTGNAVKASEAQTKMKALQEAKQNEKGSNPEQNPVTEELWRDLNEKSWATYESLKDVKKLSATQKKQAEEAISNIKKSIELQKNYYNMDTYAHLLALTGNKKEAIIQMQEAIKLGSQAGENVKESEDKIKLWSKK